MDLTDECIRRLKEDDFYDKTVSSAEKSAVLLPTGTLLPSQLPDTSSKPASWMQMAGLCEDDQLLICGAAAAQELRNHVLKELGYTCSAGVAHNKMLAKVCYLVSAKSY